jgi:hypothetical protein
MEASWDLAGERVIASLALTGIINQDLGALRSFLRNEKHI